MKALKGGWKEIPVLSGSTTTTLITDTEIKKGEELVIYDGTNYISGKAGDVTNSSGKYEVDISSFSLTNPPEKAYKKENPSIYISKSFEQETDQNDWYKYQVKITEKPKEITILSDTTNKVLKTSDEILPGEKLLLYNSTDGLKEGIVESVSVEGWDISTVSYTGKSFDVNSEISLAEGFFFKPDGTMLYVIDHNNKKVYQYTLSTPWDISTTSYTSKSFDVGNEESTPITLFLSIDGKYLYIAGSDNATIYQYTLSIPWDISTASYTGKSIYIGDETLHPEKLFFKPDGTILIVSGQGGNVYQYTLSTPWDITTASYTGKYTTVKGTTTTGIYIKPDGSIMYTIDYGNSKIYQYRLSTPWDISTTSYTSKSFDTSSQESHLEDIFFKPDGTIMYIIGHSNKVYQYSLQSQYTTNISSFNLTSKPEKAFKEPVKVYVSFEKNKDRCLCKDEDISSKIKNATTNSFEFVDDRKNILENGDNLICNGENVKVSKVEVEGGNVFGLVDSGNEDILQGITIDSNSNVFVCGYTNYDHYIAKFDKDLNLIKQIIFDSGHYDESYGITTDSNGNVYVCGHVRTGSNYNQFIAKLNPDLEFNTTTFKLNNITFNIKEVSYPVTEQSWTPTEQSWIPHKQSWTPIEHTWTPKTVNYPYYKYVDGYKIKVDIDKTLSSTISSVIIPNRSEEQELEKREYDSTNDKIISTYKAITKAEKPGRAIKFRVDGVKDTEVDEVAIDLWTAQTT